MVHLIFAALAAAAPRCWDIYERVLAHSAASPHPRFISYNEHIAIFEDGDRIISSRANVDYRDDGLARVADERFGYDPIVTRAVEPGPPELGPYGPGRAMWLPPPPGAPTIATVRVKSAVACTNEGIETYRGSRVYHLRFHGADPQRAHLRALWVDARSMDVWKVALAAPVRLVDGSAAAYDLANYEVELSYRGPYLVVDHVTWSLGEKAFSQSTTYRGDYTFSGYSFPAALPSSYFVPALQK